MENTTNNRSPEQLAAALEAAEKRFDEALQSARHIMYRLNAQRGGYDYLSPFIEELTGHLLADFKQITLQELPEYFHPDDRERIFGKQGVLAEAAHRRVGDQAFLLVEYRLRKFDGSYCWLRDLSTIHFTADGQIDSIVGAAYDITAQKQAEANLNENEARYRTLFETMHEGFAFHEIICNEQGEPVDYRYLDINPAFERLTGLQRETTIGKRVREVIPGIEEHWITTFGQVALTGKPAEMENYVHELDRYYRAKAYSPERGKFAVVFDEVTEQKKLLRDLEEREAQLRVLFDSSYAGIILVDTAGRITLANQRMAEMFGCSLPELVGSFYPQHVHPDEQGLGDERMRQLIRGEIDFVGTERHYVRRDGSDFWGFLSGRRHEDADGQLISLVGHITDISELKATRDNLQSLLQQHQVYFTSMPTGCIVWDRDFRALEWNPAAERIFGIPATEAIGQAALELIIPPSAQAHVWQVWQDLLQGKEFVQSTNENLTRDGRIIQCDWYNTPLLNTDGTTDRVLSIVQDITERKQADEAIKASEELFRSIMAISPDIISIISEEGELLYNSPAALQIHGYSQEDMVGMNTFDLIHPDDQAQVGEAFQEILRNPSLTVTVQYRYRNKDGQYSTMECSANNQLANPSIHGVIAISRNIDDRKALEEERLHLEQQLLHAQKLESLGVLAGGIAHDFNNILTAIIGNAELALMRLNPESPVLDNLQRIEKAAARAADLARQMLAYSGKGKFMVEAIDLNRLVQEMGHMMEVSISKKAVLRYNLTPSLPAVNVDATQIRQIIMNLVINASEAIGDQSGVIAITTGCLECNEAYLQEFWLTDPIPEGLYVSLEIADTGCGMDKATLGKIFDPFFTTKFTGRGLGMAAVLGIVRGHKGAIKVYSEPGKGSSFKVLLPAGERPAALFNGEETSDIWRGCGVALLVDDEETVRAIGAEMLRELGFEVITATDGRDAVAKYTARNDICLVILDLTMPHMDGEQCFRELRALDPNVKVIMSSGFSEHEVIQKFAGKGVAGFVQKPYKLSALKEVLRHTSLLQEP